MSYAVEMCNIVKTYPGVVACGDVSLAVEEGEIHGLIGENGAGKTTMMNILYGLIKPDAGTILLHGQEAAIDSPHMAIELGISMVHQHFMLMPNLTVLQNIILGKAPVRRGLIDVRAARSDIGGIMEVYNLHVDLDARIYQLSVGEKQRVEIIKALYRKSRILILDEPTAVLTPAETVKLMDVLNVLKTKGCSIIFITHKLVEVMSVTDSITVMRKGQVTGCVKKTDTNAKQLSTMMVGREVDLNIPRDAFHPSDCILEVENLCALNQRSLPALTNVSFSVRRGEIVGIAGVEGNGQTELVDLVSGIAAPKSGTVRFYGHDITKTSVRKRREMGISHVPEDRLKRGAAKNCTIYENLILNRYYQPNYARATVMNRKKLTGMAERLCERFAVKAPGTEYALSTLSGGNMQKVVFAREMETEPELLIAAQPSRGVDIGAIEYIHRQIIALRCAGKGVLLVSAELDEILSLSDRILIMYEGQIVADLLCNETDEREIGEYMMGSKRRDGAQR